MILAVAQIGCHPHELSTQFAVHQRMVKAAIKAKAELILFPEMSLSSYMRKGAWQHAFAIEDERLEPLQTLAKEGSISIISGAPILKEDKVFIGACIFHAEGGICHYLKRYLHAGEEAYFAAGPPDQLPLSLNTQAFHLAICAEIDAEAHLDQCLPHPAKAYLASLYFTPGGMEGANKRLSNIARDHQWPVLMANYTGEPWEVPAGGGSAVWDARGKQVAALGPNEEGILVVECEEENCQYLSTHID